MLWQKLGEGKDPEFKKYLFLTSGIGFCGGFLRSIEETDAGKKYTFGLTVENDQGESIDMIYDKMTHFCIPVQP
jgi:hypothetical protein